jgi:hypothetical protein
MNKEIPEFIKTKIDKENPLNVKKDWQLKRGTKEVEISRVRFINRWGMGIQRFKEGGNMAIEVTFHARKKIADPHFGVAVFRNDKIYCYGPNTVFDKIGIGLLDPGPGKFSIKYNEFPLSPGEYYVSAAIWDPDESNPYDYHCACYKFEVTGKKTSALYNERYTCSEPSDKEKKTGRPGVLSALINKYGDEKSVFKTNSGMKIILQNIDSLLPGRDDVIDVYRTDGLLCFQIRGFLNKAAATKKWIKIEIPSLRLLSGAYKIYAGNKEAGGFFVYSDIKDHGVVYMPHRWNIKFIRRQS